MSYGSSKNSFESGLNSMAVSIGSASHVHRDVGIPGDVRHRGLAAAGFVDRVLGESPRPLLERDPGLEPGQRGADAHVDAVAEAHREPDVAVDVEGVGIVVLALVAVRGPG